MSIVGQIDDFGTFGWWACSGQGVAYTVITIFFLETFSLDAVCSRR